MRMKFLLLGIAVAIGSASTVSAEQGAAPAASTGDVNFVRELEMKSWVAWKAQDAAFFEQSLSEDHVEIHGNGMTGRAAVVSGVRSGICVVQSYSLGAMSAAVIAPDVVLVTYRAEQETRCGSAKVPSPVSVASLYVERSGRWLNVLYQQTPVT
jgi:hypothetical protein